MLYFTFIRIIGFKKEGTNKNLTLFDLFCMLFCYCTKQISWINLLHNLLAVNQKSNIFGPNSYTCIYLSMQKHELYSMIFI